MRAGAARAVHPNRDATGGPGDDGILHAPNWRQGGRVLRTEHDRPNALTGRGRGAGEQRRQP